MVSNSAPMVLVATAVKPRLDSALRFLVYSGGTLAPWCHSRRLALQVLHCVTYQGARENNPLVLGPTFRGGLSFDGLVFDLYYFAYKLDTGPWPARFRTGNVYAILVEASLDAWQAYIVSERGRISKCAWTCSFTANRISFCIFVLMRSPCI